jgi:hypothetical protein
MSLSPDTFRALGDRADECLKSAGRLRRAIKSTRTNAAQREYWALESSLGRLYSEVMQTCCDGDKEERWREFRAEHPDLAEAAAAFANSVREVLRNLPRAGAGDAHLRGDRWEGFAVAADRLAQAIEGVRNTLLEWRIGSQAQLLRELGFTARHYPGKLESLRAAGMIRLRRIDNPGRKRPLWAIPIADIERFKELHG